MYFIVLSCYLKKEHKLEAKYERLHENKARCDVCQTEQRSASVSPVDGIFYYRCILCEYDICYQCAQKHDYCKTKTLLWQKTINVL